MLLLSLWLDPVSKQRDNALDLAFLTRIGLIWL